MATDWAIGVNRPGATDSTIACSKIPYPGYTNLFKQRVTFGGTADGALCFMQQAASNWSTGDVVVCEAELDLNIAAGSVTGIWLQICDQTATQISSDGNDFGFGDLATDANSIVLRPEPFTVPADTSTLYFGLCVRLGSGGGALDATVDWARASLRKVN